MKKKQVIIQVSLNGEIQYMTEVAYQEFRLTLSTGDFHVHKARRLKRLPKSIPSYRVRDAEYFNPRIKYPTVESIIEAYTNEDASAEEYSESEDSSLADFVSSLFYGEIGRTQLLESARFEDETVELIKAFSGSTKELFEIIESVSELRRVDIHVRDGEFCSATIGEQEHQVDDILAEAYQTLTAEEKLRVQNESGAGLFSSSRDDGRFIYTSDNYSRWVMIADEEALQRKLKRAAKTALNAVSNE
jgi:hypothetical protein